MAWKENSCTDTKSSKKFALSLIDIQADPNVEELIAIPDYVAVKDNQNNDQKKDDELVQLSSSVAPFLDVERYTS